MPDLPAVPHERSSARMGTHHERSSARAGRRNDGLRDALRDVLCASPVSVERLRAVVVRFAGTAHEWAAAADDVVAAVLREARPYLAQLPAARRAELSASIQWWTVHGFHRAD